MVTSHELVREVSRKAKIFCSSRGFQFEEVPEDILSAAGSFLGMDDPCHAKLRRLVSTAFTPSRSRASTSRSAIRPGSSSTTCWPIPKATSALAVSKARCGPSTRWSG